MLDFKIHYSGSKGNCAVISNTGGDWSMMVDAGKSFKSIEPYLYDVQFLLYTHRHSWIWPH